MKKRPEDDRNNLEEGGEITVANLSQQLSAGWRSMVVGAIGCVLLGLLFLAMGRPVYTSTMVAAPVPQTTQSSNTASALSGVLGALTGSPGGQTDEMFKRYQALYSSVTLAERLQQRYHLLQTIYRTNWDEKGKRWTQRPTLKSFLTAPLNALAGVPNWTPPSVTDLANYLEENVLVHSTLQNDLVRISYTSSDPVFASALLSEVHETADDLLREQAAFRAQRKVVYLEHKLAVTNVEDYRQALLGLLSEQQKILLLTQPGTPYAAELVDKPTTAPRPSAPKPALIILIAILLGIALGGAVTLAFGPIVPKSIKGLVTTASVKSP